MNVYLVKSANNLYKIGIANDVNRRFDILYAQSPISLDLLLYIEHEDACELEQALHQQFANKRHHGEWFCLAPEDVKQIASHEQTIHVDYRRHGIRSFQDRMGRIGYSALCPNCNNRSRVRQLKTCLILKCKHCKSLTKFDYPKD